MDIEFREHCINVKSIVETDLVRETNPEDLYHVLGYMLTKDLYNILQDLVNLLTGEAMVLGY